MCIRNGETFFLFLFSFVYFSTTVKGFLWKPGEGCSRAQTCNFYLRMLGICPAQNSEG